MMGDSVNPGVIPLTFQEIFQQIEEIEKRVFLVRIGYMEIYNEKIYDLLVEKRPECPKLYEHSSGEVTVNQQEVRSVGFA
jgi:hypothetical protein